MQQKKTNPQLSKNNMLSHRSSNLERASRLLLWASPGGTCCCSKYWRWCASVFTVGKPEHIQSPKLLGALYFPISRPTATHLPNLDSRITLPVKFILKPDKIKIVSSVVSETCEETSIIIFRRFSCDFLFTYLLQSKGQVKQRDRLQR